MPVPRWLTHKRVLIGVLLAVVFLINAPALSIGWFGDDYAHRRFILDHLQGQPGQPSPIAWWNMFDWRFSQRDAFEPGSLFGRLPWWAAPGFSFALLRPLSTASHFLDYILWPESPWAMHLHNIVLLCLVVWIAGDLYWRLFRARAGAALALVLFAVADAHTTSAAWIASRNTLLTALFVLSTIWLYQRTWSDSAVWCARAAPVALLCAHASSEGAIVAWAYLAAFALCLDPRPPAARLRSLLPMAAVSLAWLGLSAHFGYGIRGSAIYIDPRSDPVLFAAAVVQRLPELLEMQFAVAREFVRTRAPELQALWSAGVIVYALLLVAGVAVYARRSTLVRCFALASLGALIPQCAAGSFARLLLLSGFAAHGLVAALAVEFAAPARRSVVSKLTLGVFATGTLIFHGFVALVLPGYARGFAAAIHTSVARAAESLPSGASRQSASIVALNFPDYLRSVFVDLYRRELFAPGPRRMDFVGTTLGRVAVTRTAPDAFELEPEAGYLLDPTHLLVRTPNDRFHAGQGFQIGSLDLTILRTTPDGRPARVRIRGDELESGSTLWMCWTTRLQRFEPCTLPALGGTSEIDVER